MRSEVPLTLLLLASYALCFLGLGALFSCQGLSSNLIYFSFVNFIRGKKSGCLGQNVNMVVFSISVSRALKDAGGGKGSEAPREAKNLRTCEQNLSYLPPNIPSPTF